MGTSSQSTDREGTGSSRQELAGGHIGHVRIDALLGSGGMGDVYRGFDEKLERKVAVKTIQPIRLAGHARSRFLREARLLSKLDHPNICRVFELLERDECDYLILELIEGKTLKEAARAGLDETEKLRISEQVATALAAAHRKKVVHRDLKPENIMVTPDGGIKVLDFGIARSLEHMAPAPPTSESEASTISTTEPEIRSDAIALSTGSLYPTQDLVVADDDQTCRTKEGAIVGTAPYMSPEQVTGQTVTEASDIYSFGILLQELFTGKAAYGEATGVGLLLKVAQGETEPIEGLDPELSALITELQSREASERPAAEEVLERLQGLRRKPERARRRRRLLATAAAMLLVLVSAILITRHLTQPQPLYQPGEVARVTLLPFRNLTGDPGHDWVELGLMEMVAETLDTTPEVEVVPPANLLDALKELAIDRHQELSAADLARVGRALGTRLVVATEVSRIRDEYTFAYTVFDSGGSLGSKQVTADDPFTGANLVNARLAQRLNPASLFRDLRDQYSDDAFANLAFAMGRHRYEIAGPSSARLYFDVCLDRDPGFLQARARSATALFDLGEWDQFEEISKLVREEARRRQDLKVEAEIIGMTGRLTMDRGKYGEAEELLQQALTLYEQAGEKRGQAFILYSLGGLAYRQRQLAEAEELLLRSLEMSRSIGSRKDEPLPMSMLAYIATARNDHAGAIQIMQEALEISRELGMKERIGGMLVNLATVAQRHGELGPARTHLEEAIAILQETGNVRGRMISTYNYGALLGEEGDLEGAVEALPDAISLAKEVGNLRIEVMARAALAYFSCRLGRLETAETELATARELAGELEDRVILWSVTRNSAYLRILQGRLDEAGRLLAEPAPITDIYTLEVQARYQYARGRYQRALATLEEARQLPRTIWTAWREATRQAYEKAARSGVAVPLPGELRPEITGDQR
jgi:serine/threonine protein kinase/tetratricopeptide (TPR) repeat protein/TolB-like protein